MTEVIVSQHALYPGGRDAVDGFVSRPVAAGRWPAVVIAHDWWGLNEWGRDLTRSIAEQGFVALTPDLYRGVTTTDPLAAARLKGTLDHQAAVEDLIDAATYLRGLPFVSGRIGVMGLCMGGGIALLAACRSRAFDAAVLFHHSIYPDEREIEQLACPVQGHYGLADAVTPLSEVEIFVRQLERHDKPHEVHYYEGAGHGWLNPKRPALYREDAARLSIERTAAFLGRHLASIAESSGG